MTYYSVLIKHDLTVHSAANGVAKSHAVKEVYRLKLPGNPVLGEGKPENQNHAIVFSRGRYLQAIDMNQDGYFEEALKMRNALQEFDSGCSIVGLREHIFTGSVSSVANYMALQELSFVTLGQRVLNEPLRIRQHYGHPDLFDKMFVMTEGGMSKASRGINLSEDVFAGFNATIRGHTIQFKEYVQVGKGRDVGLQQTYKFEAKLSQGNAEQSLSRDVARICDRLDFFRLMSFYFGGIGHYIANTMVMFCLVVVVYTMLGLAIYDEEGVNGRPMHPEGVLQLLLSGMGLLQTLPLCVTLTIEKGILPMLGEVIFMMISGGPLYFIFYIQTKCHYFQQTLIAGGAMYRPTGRGFVIRHSPFDENYRFFATSHIYLGVELMVALLLFAMYTTSKQYGGLTWSLWVTSVAFILGPFWFNPVTFEWNKLTEDYSQWLR
jgi:callose synthase